MKEHNVKFGLQLPDDVLAEEISFATEAIYIFPADQSSWIYLQWLLSAAPAPPRLLRGMLHNNTVAIVLSEPAKITTTTFECRIACEDQVSNKYKDESSSDQMATETQHQSIRQKNEEEENNDCVTIESAVVLDEEGKVWLLNLASPEPHITLKVNTTCMCLNVMVFNIWWCTFN
eukprot:m.75444 g.75444  ORF g.75444 m.75444 type:complete len:175 (+) comp11843_c0_seq18:170-694(+)